MEARAMTYEYGDPFNREAIEKAVARVLRFRWEAPDVPLEQHVEVAVHEHFCACVVDIEDQIEQRRSGIHDTIASEVRQRVQIHLIDDRIDEAPKDSFPASDSGRMDLGAALPMTVERAATAVADRVADELDG